MSNTATKIKIDEPSTDWVESNRLYLEKQLKRLRLMLYRRVLWLRKQWKHDPLQEYQGLVISDAHADWLLAGENAEAEMRFYLNDQAGLKLTRSIEKLVKEIKSQDEMMKQMGRPVALHLLAHLFNLTPFDQDVLLLCLAPGIDPAFERLYAYVQDDVTRKYATPYLAVSLFGYQDPETTQYSFLETSPLRSNRLVRLMSMNQTAFNKFTSPLQMDERMSAYLRGFNHLDGRVNDLLKPLFPVSLSKQHQELVKSLAGWAEAKAMKGVWPAINLVSSPGTGKQAIAAALCERIGFHLYRLDIERLSASSMERKDLLKLLAREAALLQIGYYIDVSESNTLDKEWMSNVTLTVEHLNAWLIVGSRERCSSDRPMLSVRVPKVSARDQQKLWKQALGKRNHPAKRDIGDIIQHFDFGPKAITRVVTEAKERSRLLNPGIQTKLSRKDLWRACREHMAAQMDELAKRIIPVYTWDDIVLPADTFQQLKEIGAQAENRYKVYEDWAFGAKLSRGCGINALFSGPSGTGKTMAAEVLANDLNLDLYRIDLATVVSKYIGETEKNLRKVFDAAEQSGAILFFDEADALFGKRTEVKDSHDRYANLEVNYLLQRMEGYRGLAILATNRESDLDRAFLRRLRFLVDFPFPNADSRRSIWEKVFPEQTPKDKLDYKTLAKLEIPGGNIRNIALNAAFLAASENRPIGMAEVMGAARREYIKMEKMITENEFAIWYPQVMS